MQVRWFSKPIEINFIGKKWNLRIGTKQVALWRYYIPVFIWTKFA